MIAPASEILDRLPPQNLDAEKGVLGSVLLHPPVLDEIARLRPDNFHADAHRKLFRHLLAVRDEGKRIDTTLLVERLKQAGDFETIGGASYLAEVAHAVAVPAHAAHYAKIVRDKAVLRALIHTTTEILRDAYAPEAEPRDIVARAEEALAAIDTGEYAGEPVAATAAAAQFVALVDDIAAKRRQAGLMTGLEAFDQEFGGLFQGELTILAARPSVGKTALACQIGQYAAERGRPVYFGSLEMSAVELVGRMACSLCGVSSKEIRTGTLTRQDQAKLAEATNRVASSALRIHDRAGLTVYEIRRAARRMRREQLALVIVDYLQRITPADARLPRHQQVGQMTDGLKQVARELDVPVLCLCQLNRESEKESRPRLSHLRESGSIEQDADVVLILHRQTSGSTKEEAKDRQATLYVEKNRNGETGALQLTWVPERVRYESEW